MATMTALAGLSAASSSQVCAGPWFQSGNLELERDETTKGI